MKTQFLTKKRKITTILIEHFRKLSKLKKQIAFKVVTTEALAKGLRKELREQEPIPNITYDVVIDQHTPYETVKGFETTSVYAIPYVVDGEACLSWDVYPQEITDDEEKDSPEKQFLTDDTFFKFTTSSTFGDVNYLVEVRAELNLKHKEYALQIVGVNLPR